MIRKSRSLPDKKTGRPQRGDRTRQKLLSAAIEVFGRLGFEGASTRALADAAGVNLQSIPYYFGDKKGLYIAAAEHIVAHIGAHMAEARERVRARLAEAERNAVPIEISEARDILTEIVQNLATLYVSREMEQWARFMMREQIEPTEAFIRIYNGVMKPGMDVTGRLLAIMLDEPPGSEHIRLRTLSLVGSILMFRMGHASAMTYLGWKGIGAPEVGIIRNLAAELVAAISPREPNP